MIKKTQWSPDTCECVLQYTWDTEKTAETREHVFDSVIKTCDAHTILKSKNLYDKVKDENVLKNKALKELETALPEFHTDLKNEDDEVVGKKTKQSAGLKWSFDNDRKLVIEIKEFKDIKKKDNVKKILTDKFGDNKIDLK